jgi:hypothetical protein
MKGRKQMTNKSAGGPRIDDEVVVITDDAIRPFRVEVPEEALVDLRRRIGARGRPAYDVCTKSEPQGPGAVGAEGVRD